MSEERWPIVTQQVQAPNSMRRICSLVLRRGALLELREHFAYDAAHRIASSNVRNSNCALLSHRVRNSNNEATKWQIRFANSAKRASQKLFKLRAWKLFISLHFSSPLLVFAKFEHHEHEIEMNFPQLAATLYSVRATTIAASCCCLISKWAARELQPATTSH